MYSRLVIPSVPISPTDLIGDPDRNLEQQMWDTNIKHYTQDVPRSKNKRIRVTFHVPSENLFPAAREMTLSIYDAFVNSGFIKKDEQATFHTSQCVVDMKPSTVIDIWGE